MKDLKIARNAAFLFAITLVILDLSYVVLMISNSVVEWTGINDYAAEFRVLGLLPVFAGILILIPYIILCCSWHSILKGTNKIWSMIGSIFGGIFVAITGTTYLIQLIIVLPRITGGQLVGLENLVFANPKSVAWGLNNIGWFFLGLSTIFYMLVLGDTRLERRIRLLFGFYGVSSILLIVGYATDSIVLQLPIIFSWFLIQPMAYFMLSASFNKKIKEEEDNEITSIPC